MRILWIDPWTTTVWYCILETENWKIKIIDYWVISTLPKINIEVKLLEIWNDLKEIIKNFKIEKIVVEKLYFQNNVKTAIDVAQSRWVILYEAIKHNLIIEQYTPLQVKKAITWNWKANKKQLEKAIQILFWLENIPDYDDASDAIWMAYMWALNKNFLEKS